MSELSDLVSGFVERLSAAIEADAMARVRSNLDAVFGRNGRAHPAGVVSLPIAVRKRRKGPIQLCPVPGCTNRAAPIFGMVCSEHKDLPKSKIRQYREARKSAKDGKPNEAAAARARSGRKPRTAKRRSTTLKRAGRPLRKRPTNGARQAVAKTGNGSTPASALASA